MATVTIKNTAGTTFTFAFGEVDKVRSQIAADVEQTAFPGGGPSNAFNFDFSGPLKIINLTGVLFETSASRTDSGSVTTILEQKQWLEQNISGLQTSTTFTSTYDTQTFDGSSFTNTTIMFGQMEFNEEAGNPELLPFTMQLLVGG